MLRPRGEQWFSIHCELWHAKENKCSELAKRVQHAISDARTYLRHSLHVLCDTLSNRISFWGQSNHWKPKFVIDGCDGRRNPDPLGSTKNQSYRLELERHTSLAERRQLNQRANNWITAFWRCGITRWRGDSQLLWCFSLLDGHGSPLSPLARRLQHWDRFDRVARRSSATWPAN